MLPTKFFDPLSGSAASSRTQRVAPPPLGMTGVMCKTGSLDIPGRGTIRYRIFRPRQLQQKAPLVVLHGGPLIPCNYLLPLAYVIVDRSIIFYDQLGCGQSSNVASLSVLTKKTEEGKSSSVLDVDAMVKDLDLLLEHWNLSQYHLLGHSFGGILLFQYLKYCASNKPPETLSKCRSAVLASAPTSTKMVEEEVQRLCQELASSGITIDDDEEDEDYNSAGVSALPKKAPKRFREEHECRMVPTPFPLLDSYSQAGSPRLRGLQSIGNYAATPLSPDPNAIEGKESTPNPMLALPPALVLRGQYDFVTEACVQDWDQLIDCKYMTLAGCSHYGMLENEVMYGSVLSSFLGDNDDQIK